MTYHEPTPDLTPGERQLAHWRTRALTAEAEVDHLRTFFADGIDAYDAHVYATTYLSPNADWPNGTEI